jgi:Protein of unknown function (DUF3455)
MINPAPLRQTRLPIMFALPCAALVTAALFVTPADAQLASVPASTLVAGPDETVALAVNAAGVQIYDCKAAADGKLAWTFKEPRADLTVGGKTVGKHYAGPHWEMADGSTVKAAGAARADGATPNDIPWLRLAVTESKGAGQLSGVTAVLRTNTKGGVLAGTCPTAGLTQEQAYTSDYVFLKKK